MLCPLLFFFFSLKASIIRFAEKILLENTYLNIILVTLAPQAFAGILD